MSAEWRFAEMIELTREMKVGEASEWAKYVKIIKCSEILLIDKIPDSPF